MIVALAGGVGGARLAAGLAAILPAGGLTVIVNTGDDFTHMGLRICPDIDTVTYTLAGVADAAQGWGLAGESFACMDRAKRLGAPDWFALGDRDLATHIVRTERLRQGEPLSAITVDFARRLGVGQHILPVSDDPLATIVETDEGPLAFQDYFVRRRAAPRFRGLLVEGSDAARPAPGVLDALRRATAIVICPSNPWLSLSPILAVPGIVDALRGRACPAVAVSPFIGGRAVKGPAAKIMAELGRAADPAAVADHYAGLIDGLVIDRADAALPCPVPTRATDTLMRDDADRRRLAEETLAFALRP